MIYIIKLDVYVIEFQGHRESTGFSGDLVGGELQSFESVNMTLIEVYPTDRLPLLREYVVVDIRTILVILRFAYPIEDRLVEEVVIDEPGVQTERDGDLLIDLTQGVVYRDGGVIVLGFYMTQPVPRGLWLIHYQIADAGHRDTLDTFVEEVNSPGNNSGLLTQESVVLVSELLGDKLLREEDTEKVVSGTKTNHLL